MIRIANPNQINANQKILVVSRDSLMNFQIKGIDSIIASDEAQYTYQNAESQQVRVFNKKTLLDRFEVYEVSSDVNPVDFMEKYTGSNIQVLSQFAEEIITITDISSWEKFTTQLSNDLDFYFRFVNWYTDHLSLIQDLHFNERFVGAGELIAAKNKFDAIQLKF